MKPKVMCLICYVEYEFYNLDEYEQAYKYKITDRFVKHKGYCWIFKLIYKLTGKKII